MLRNAYGGVDAKTFGSLVPNPLQLSGQPIGTRARCGGTYRPVGREVPMILKFIDYRRHHTVDLQLLNSGPQCKSSSLCFPWQTVTAISCSPTKLLADNPLIPS